ncbi:hypothetical protein A2U01_0073500, partial [Trifolium medium]|nr:hypothetical protein [Trifolium medium]
YFFPSCLKFITTTSYASTSSNELFHSVRSEQ